ncbi:MAG: T9SS type A sorting domain-containing protein, partial [Saprospiraceae bacterium]|nr:T9SS type A sorting domain-containing protein [Saprospiraceae bacterium]
QAGNVWAAAGSAVIFPIGVAARYVDNNTVPFKFLVNPNPSPALPPGRTYLPPSGIPQVSSWFFPDNGSVTGCTVVLPEFSKSEHEIALGIYPYGNDAEAWDQQRQLWYKMLRHPDWVASNDTIKNFHDATWGTSAQRFAAVQWQFEQAFSPESNLSATLLSLYEDYNSVVSDIVSLEEIISADTTTLNTGHVATLQNALNDWAEIAGEWTEASHTYAVERDNKLDAVKDSLLVLPDNEPWEQAWIAMLEVAVGRGKAAEGEEMTETDRESLASIAEACPEYVGLARRIVITYMTPEDGLIYMGKENTEGCTVYGVQRVTKNVYDWEDIKITPNPANQYLRIQLPAAQRAHWSILSTTGHLLLHGDWQEGVKEQFISLGQLPGGSYILRIQRGSGVIQSARFSVIK